MFYVRRPEHDIMFGLNNLISQIVQAHSRRPKGSQSGRGEKVRRKFSSAGERALLPLVFFRRTFSPGPTDCPWVSEDGPFKQE